MPKPKPKSNFSQIIRLAAPYWSRLLAVSATIIVTSFIRQIPPQIQRGLIDQLTEKTPFVFSGLTFSFTTLLFGFLFIIIITTILDRLMWSLTNKFDVRFRYRLREIAYDQLLKLSITYYNKNQSGSLVSKIERGAAQITSAIRNISANILPNIITAIIAVFVVATIRWEIALMVIVGFLIYFPIRIQRFKKIEKLDRLIQKHWDQHSGHFHEAISSIRLVKSFSSEPHELSLYQKFAHKNIKHSDKIDHIETTFIFANIFLNVWMWGILAYVFYLGLQNQYSIGTIILLIQYVDIIRQPFTSLEWTFWEIKRAKVGAEDYLKILNASDYTQESNTPIKPEKITGNITFRNVSFTYPEKGGQHVFQNFSFDIKPGQTLAVVGKSGAGKTTLAHLLIRFFDPTNGVISIDDYDIKELDLKYLRKNIGLVMQQSYLFADTVAENLRYGKPDATLKEMEIACKIANADEFINQLPKKYQTKIGERGIKLSGGQQQRLSIARTILKNPPILILDEATSSLDSQSERLVQDAIWKLIKGRTAIIIAHRLSTIQKANQIIVLGQKKIIEQGTHAELIKKKKGVYASLHQIQSGQITKLKSYDLIS